VQILRRPQRAEHLEREQRVAVKGSEGRERQEIGGCAVALGGGEELPELLERTRRIVELFRR
jgi:hypothetical protein